MRHLFFLLTTDERCARDSARSVHARVCVCVRACVRVRAGQQSEESDSVSRVSVCGYVVFIRVPRHRVRMYVHACDTDTTGARVSFIFCYFSLCILTIRTPSRRLIAFANESKRVSHDEERRGCDEPTGPCEFAVDLDKGARK